MTKRDALWVVTTYFNPAGYRSRRENYRRFRTALGDLPCLTVECALADQPFELPPSPDVLPLRAHDALWHKERLINLAISKLPRSCHFVAWIDADVLFQRLDWPARASLLVGDYDEARATLARRATRWTIGLLLPTMLLATVASLLLAALAPDLWHMSWQTALALSGALAMSSTAIVVKLMSERLELESEHGKRVMGVLLFQDLAVVPLLVLIPALGSSPEKLLGALAAWIIGRWLIAMALRLLNAAFQRGGKVDQTLANYLTSILSVILNIVLILAILDAPERPHLDTALSYWQCRARGILHAQYKHHPKATCLRLFSFEYNGLNADRVPK